MLSKAMLCPPVGFKSWAVLPAEATGLLESTDPKLIPSECDFIINKYYP